MVDLLLFLNLMMGSHCCVALPEHLFILVEVRWGPLPWCIASVEATSQILSFSVVPLPKAFRYQLKPWVSPRSLCMKPLYVLEWLMGLSLLPLLMVPPLGSSYTLQLQR